MDLTKYYSDSESYTQRLLPDEKPCLATHSQEVPTDMHNGGPRQNKIHPYPQSSGSDLVTSPSSQITDISDNIETDVKVYLAQNPATETSRLTHGNRPRSYGYNTYHQTENGFDANERRAVSNLSVLHVSYVVKEWVGPWWKGACFRKVRKKLVLDNLSIQSKAGQVTAILGNSGSGKTSLLDVITRRSKGEVTGDVYFNNAICTRDVIKQHAAYVMQADRLLPNLTVRETLRYSACLKLPGGTPAAEVDDKVSAVIMEMGLKDVADSRIGSSIIRGISGGEKRRVTIAIQLLKDPDMVLLDEPTSGLDSYTARYLVSNLRKLARRGKIVLLTIHQPSSDIFQFFDQIALMSIGQLVYCGPAKDLVLYFTQLGYPCDKYTNPLDRYVDVASIDRRDSVREEASTARVDKLVRSFKTSVLNQFTEESILEMSQKYSETGPPRKERISGPSYPRVLWTVLSRMTRNLFRDRKDYVARLILLPFSMIFILMFLGRFKQTQSSIQDRVGLLYNSATAPPFVGIMNGVALFPCLRDLYYRETVDGLYGTATFLVSYTIHILPFHIASSIIYSSIIYWVPGLQPQVDKFGYFTLVVFLLQYWGEIVSISFMGIFLNSNMANSISVLMLTVSVLIGSGFVKDVQSLVSPFKWVSWALILTYAAEIYVANELEGLQLSDCPKNATVSCFENGDQFLDLYYPGATDHMARNFGVLGGYAVCTLVLAIIVYKVVGPKTLH